MNGDVIPLKREPFDLEALMVPPVPEVKKPKPHFFRCVCCGHWIDYAVWPARGCEACKGAA